MLGFQGKKARGGGDESDECHDGDHLHDQEIASDEWCWSDSP